VNRPVAVVVGCHWRDADCELAFATRSLAGAASRLGPLAVLVPAAPQSVEADGLFDLCGMGVAGSLQWPDGVPPDTTIIVDELTADVAQLLHATPRAPVFSLSESHESHGPSAASWHSLRLVGGEDPVGVHVPINRLAAQHRHHGFGFTDYVLVLSDRTGDEGVTPPPAAAWVSAAFPEADVVVVEDAVAWAWKGRALRGKVSVDTRMDLWRLLAHANVCIDLAPGPTIARECIEALRFGTPIIVPDWAEAASVHAYESEGGTFGDPDDLLREVARMRDGADRSRASDAGRRYSESRFGDPATLVARLQALLPAA
jgi:hypothetical protein